MTTQIKDLDAKLRKIQQNTAFAFSEADRAKLEEMYNIVRVEVQLLYQGHAIIQSLQYGCMEARYDAIKDAHARTFDWIFTETESQDALQEPTSGFAQWLQAGSGTYWVTGKPGNVYAYRRQYPANRNDKVVASLP